MNDVECPYCGHGQEVCHDDGHGLDEGRRHEDMCESCEKSFVFSTSISILHKAAKADCLNGTAHNLEPWKFSTPDTYPDAVRCQDCDYEKRGCYVEPDGGRP